MVDGYGQTILICEEVQAWIARSLCRSAEEKTLVYFFGRARLFQTLRR